MKRIIKVRKRPAMLKKGLNRKRRFFKRIRKSQKNYNQINAPHNTSQYLIENNSSPFYEDDEDSNICVIPSSQIILDDTEDLFNDYMFDYRKMTSTSTQGESFSKDSHIDKQTSILPLN